MFIHSVRNSWPGDTESYLRRPESSVALLWEPQMSQIPTLFLHILWLVKKNSFILKDFVGEYCFQEYYFETLEVQ
jgi:hypothetical protein